MARRRIEVTDVWRVTVDTCEGPVLIDRYKLRIQILSKPVFVMAFSTRCDRYIGFQSSKRCGFGDVDVTGRALGYVLLFLATSFMQILDRNPHWLSDWYVRRRKLVTAVAVGGDGLLRFPVAVETGRVISWRRLERCGPCRVADGAVVVALLCVRETHHRDHVLVSIVRKLDRELQLRRRISKRISRLVTRRSLRMTNGTDGRLRAFEKLLPVTAHASVVIRIVLDIRIGGRIFCRYLVTGITGCLVLLCGVGEFRIISRG